MAWRHLRLQPTTSDDVARLCPLLPSCCASCVYIPRARASDSARVDQPPAPYRPPPRSPYARPARLPPPPALLPPAWHRRSIGCPGPRAAARAPLLHRRPCGAYSIPVYVALAALVAAAAVLAYYYLNTIAHIYLFDLYVRIYELVLLLFIPYQQ